VELVNGEASLVLTARDGRTGGLCNALADLSGNAFAIEGPGTQSTEAIAAGKAGEVQATERAEVANIEVVPGEARLLLLGTLVVGVIGSSIALVTTPPQASGPGSGQKGKDRDQRGGLHGVKKSGSIEGTKISKPAITEAKCRVGKD
jgi:hypothetical protein